MFELRLNLRIKTLIFALVKLSKGIKFKVRFVFYFSISKFAIIKIKY